MADICHSVFKNKKMNPLKLVTFGFEKSGTCYLYNKTLSHSGFILTVRIAEQGTVTSEITDPLSGEPYTLHLVDNAVGRFVGAVKSQYEETVAEIADRCFDLDAFKSRQANELRNYVRNMYGDELEFLWEKFSGNAVWRRKDTKKWYGVLLTVSKNKLGIESDACAEIMDLRISPGALADLIDCKKYFPGYHMNKKHWYTMILDGSVPYEELCRRIDESYLLAQK